MALRRCARRGIVGALAADAIAFSSSSRVLSQLGSSWELRSALFSTICAPRATESTLLPWKRSISLLRQRRGVATDHSTETTFAEKWRIAQEKMKQAVMEKPRAVVESVKNSEFAEGTKGALSAVSAPVAKTLVSYREALKLQIEAFWRRNYLVVVGAVGLAACLLLWKVMFGIASLFVSLSEGMAKYGFLALAAAMVTFSGMVLKARYTINPDAVYRIAMRKLNTSADVLKALGAPLSGTDIRAYVMTGGGLRINNLKPRVSSKRCFLIFPIQGSEKRGLVSIETKKKQGQYDFKLLAVDIAGHEGRIYVAGDEAEYKIGGGLIAELRDPIVKAMAAQNEFEAQDDKEEKEMEEAPALKASES
ncbi:uncharacterized protein LOC9648181 [Selaginella moellendorffii]|uniref:uncharacterized protein LOC9648181 n=1 Tax=Selaginella moellendorffii TaxID=88036 RepID=UPI000D1D0540|nr:uncharacterized protein LOC9648181 [Selaginella moellendorffii]|eukprot:XP_024541133.1 uncharacterized protein LOC9648181 [Selaginella moellendorffii]